MSDAIKALPTLTHIRAFRPTGTHSILIYSAARPLIHALNKKLMFSLFIISVKVIIAKYGHRLLYRSLCGGYNIYLRGIHVTLVSALKKSYLIARGGLKFVVIVILRQGVALIHF